MIEIDLTQLEAKELGSMLRELADNVERKAIKDNRIMNVDEDLRVSIFANIYQQLLEQSHYINDKVVKEEYEDYKRDYALLIREQGKRN